MIVVLLGCTKCLYILVHCVNMLMQINTKHELWLRMMGILLVL